MAAITDGHVASAAAAAASPSVSTASSNASAEESASAAPCNAVAAAATHDASHESGRGKAHGHGHHGTSCSSISSSSTTATAAATMTQAALVPSLGTCAQLETILGTLKRCVEHSHSTKVCRRLVKSCDLFWCTVKAHVSDVNKIYMEREHQCRLQFELINIHVLRNPRILALPHVREAIQESMKILSEPPQKSESCAPCNDKEAYEEKQDQQLKKVTLVIGKLLTDSSLPSELRPALPVQFVNELMRFFTVCSQLDNLRKLVVTSYCCIGSSLTKFEQLTDVKCKTTYLGTLEHEPFYCSPMLAKLLTTMECLAGYITCSHCLEMKGTPHKHKHLTLNSFLGTKADYMCPLCDSVLKHPVVLSCSHRFCMCCLENLQRESDRCPVCNKMMNLGPVLRPDNVLNQFILEHFPQEDKHACSACTPGSTKNQESLPTGKKIRSNHRGAMSEPKQMKRKRSDIKGELRVVLNEVTSFHLRCCADVFQLPSNTTKEETVGRDYHNEYWNTSSSSMHTVNKSQSRQKKVRISSKRKRKKLEESSKNPCTDAITAKPVPSLRTNFECLTTPNCSATHLPDMKLESTPDIDDWLNTFLGNESGGQTDHHSFEVPNIDPNLFDLPFVDPLPFMEGQVPNSSQVRHKNTAQGIVPQGSCHQCKIKMDVKGLVLCTKDGCKKKFCNNCLQRKYQQSPGVEELSTWECPACIGFCSCAVCMRKIRQGLPVTTSRISCHQCKLKKSAGLFKMCNATLPGTKRNCRKKFCNSCLVRYERSMPKTKEGRWSCPACLGMCTCARCKKAKLNSSR